MQGEGDVSGQSLTSDRETASLFPSRSLSVHVGKLIWRNEQQKKLTNFKFDSDSSNFKP